MGALHYTAVRNQHIIFPAKIALSLPIFFFPFFTKVPIPSGALRHQGCLLSFQHLLLIDVLDFLIQWKLFRRLLY